MTGVFRFVFERIGATEAQQLGIIAGIERELAAGMSGAYTSGSATARYIDFAHTGSGANDPIDQTLLVAAGWTVTNATTVTKTINGRVWRVLHN